MMLYGFFVGAGLLGMLFIWLARSPKKPGSSKPRRRSASTIARDHIKQMMQLPPAGPTPR